MAIVDKWVAVNTWTIALTIEVIEKDTGVDFDFYNETHLKKLKDYTWPYLFEQMNLINFFESMMWLTNTLYFIWFPRMYIDDEGYARDGYPLMIARSLQLSEMYMGDYSWLVDPTNKKLKLEAFSFLKIVLNIFWGFL